MGYAFVNFISVEAAQKFRAKWHGFDLVPEAQTKRLDIGDAKVQGLYNNLVIVMRSRKKGKPIDPARLPAVFAKNGSVIDFQQVVTGLNVGQTFLEEDDMDQNLSRVLEEMQAGIDEQQQEASSSSDAWD
jgi:hypothetical protein